MENQPIRRAAQYLRMSTDQQQFSTQNQAAAIQAYASVRGLEIVATYQDEGKSGLTIDGRDGLQKLIADVQGSPPFEIIVVYDVSRWGRFQDTDESAYYEHVCKRAGVQVEYCAEPFANDGSPLAAVLKSLKRAMAAEYSRELSDKVWKGQRRQIELGYRQGGNAGFGLRRQAVDRFGAFRIALEKGDIKNLQSDHVVLVPGPPEEIEVVRWIYRKYIAGDSEGKILAEIRKQNVLAAHRTRFSIKSVTDILTNEKYVGTCIWNKKTAKLKSRIRDNPEKDWIRVPGAFTPIVDQATFDAAQAIRRRKRIRLSTAEMVEGVRRLYRQHGYLTGPLIDRCLGPLLRRACVHIFKGLNGLYREVGYTSLFDRSYVEIQRRINTMSAGLFDEIEGRLREGLPTVERQAKDRLTLNQKYSVALCVSRFRTAKSHALGWCVPEVPRQGKFLLRDAQRTTFFIVARLDKANAGIMDYVVIPTRVLEKMHFRITERRMVYARPQRCSKLSYLSATMLKVIAAEEQYLSEPLSYGLRPARRDTRGGESATYRYFVRKSV